jgi:hypothetical protein
MDESKREDEVANAEERKTDAGSASVAANGGVAMSSTLGASLRAMASAFDSTAFASFDPLPFLNEHGIGIALPPTPSSHVERRSKRRCTDKHPRAAGLLPPVLSGEKDVQPAPPPRVQQLIQPRNILAASAIPPSHHRLSPVTSAAASAPHQSPLSALQLQQLFALTLQRQPVGATLSGGVSLVALQPNQQATAASSASTQSNRAGDLQALLYRASASVGTSHSIDPNGFGEDEDGDDDERRGSATEGAAAERSHPDATTGNSASSSAAAPRAPGYWRCMFKAVELFGPCRRGFDTLRKVRQHLSRRHGRTKAELNTGGAIDFVATAPPSVPDRYACRILKEDTTLPCKVVRGEFNSVRTHIGCSHSWVPSEMRDIFIRVIQADAVNASDGSVQPAGADIAGSSSSAHRFDAAAEASKRNDGSAAELARPLPSAPAGSTNTGRVNRASGAAANVLPPRSSTAGGTQSARVQFVKALDAAALRVARWNVGCSVSAPDSGMPDADEAKTEGHTPLSLAPQHLPQKSRGDKREHNELDGAAAAAAGAAAHSHMSGPLHIAAVHSAEERPAVPSAAPRQPAAAAAASSTGSSSVSGQQGRKESTAQARSHSAVTPAAPAAAAAAAASTAPTAFAAGSASGDGSRKTDGRRATNSQGGSGVASSLTDQPLAPVGFVFEWSDGAVAPAGGERNANEEADAEEYKTAAGSDSVSAANGGVVMSSTLGARLSSTAATPLPPSNPLQSRLEDGTGATTSSMPSSDEEPPSKRRRVGGPLHADAAGAVGLSVPSDGPQEQMMDSSGSVAGSLVAAVSPGSVSASQLADSERSGEVRHAVEEKAHEYESPNVAPSPNASNADNAQPMDLSAAVAAGAVAAEVAVGSASELASSSAHPSFDPTPLSASYEQAAQNEQAAYERELAEIEQQRAALEQRVAAVTRRKAVSAEKAALARRLCQTADEARQFADEEARHRQLAERELAAAKKSAEERQERQQASAQIIQQLQELNHT